MEHLDAFGQASRLAPGTGECGAGAAITLDAMGRFDMAETALKGAIMRQDFYGEPDRLVAALMWQRHEADKLQIVVDRLKAKQAEQQGTE